MRMMAEISASSLERSMGTERVNQAVVQTGEMMRQNVALADQATAVATSLHKQTCHLKGASGFRIADQARI